MPDNISKLYQELKGTYELGSENDFRKYLSDGNKREALRKELASDYEVGDSASFTKYLGLNTKPKTYNKAEDNVGASVGTAVFQNPRQTKKSTPQQGKPADTRTSMPNGFGELNMQQAQQIGLGKGPVSWEHPEMPDHQETVVEKQQRMLQGKATPQEQKQVQNRLQQRKDEIAYEQETGKRLRHPVLNTDFEAPTLSHDENGNPLIGNTTDQDRVSAHQQVMAEQAEWDSLSDEEKRERKKQMQLQREMDEYEEPGFLGVTGKKLASGFINAGLGLFKTMEELTSGMIVEDASSPTGYSRTPDFDPNSNDAITSGLRNAGEYAERLSRQGEPRKGASFTDLLMSGDISGFLLKGWGTGMESAPMTLSAYNPYTMALNAISMAGNNYWQETMENPDIPTWKRATYAIGTAAIEQAVEKFADPVFKYIGGGMGKKVVQEVTEEAEKTIAKRIVNVLKDAAGEGAEEIITNFGNDTLGQALDWLDGASDYGLVAQWRDFKKQNPNASLSDFAFQKADETMNSFFGGALAGAYTSGGAQATVAGLQYAIGRTASPEQIINNPNQPVHPATLDIAQSFDRGYGLEKDEDKTAAADKYSAYRSRMEAAVGEEVLSKIDANPTAALSEIGQLGLDEEGQRILGEYIGAKAEFDGIQQRIIEDNRASRPNYVVNGNNIDEVDAEGNVVNTHEYANEDEMKAGLWELQAKRDYQDMQADINMIRLNPKYDYDALIGGFAEEIGLDVDYIESILNKDPLELSDPESAMVSEFADLLHSTLYDNTEIHEEQSTQDGAKLADAMSIDINDISEDNAAQAQQLMNELNAAQQALNDAFAKNEDLKQEVESMEQQGMPHQGIIASLDSFRPAEVQAVIDFYNATAKFDGFRNQMAQKIDEEAANSTKRHTLNGTINGQADLGNIYTISDGTNEYYLVSGNITTDSATGQITGSTSGLIIGMDLDGSFVQIGDTNGYSLTPNVISAAQFEEQERIRLQEAWSVAIDPNGAAQAATGQQATEQSGNAGGEAGATTGTGANEPPAPAPVLSDETNEYGKRFVVSADGSTTFGEITADSGLTPAPIKLSEGEDRIDEHGRHHGYGLKHIEASHGDQIRKAGYSSVQSFVEDVARNYDTIREGNPYGDSQSYLLEITDEKNNTVFVELSRDGNYWNVNSAGIFRKSYSRNKKEVQSLPTIGSDANAATTGVNHGQTEGATVTSENSPLTSGDKDTENIDTNQEINVKVDKNGVKLYEEGTPLDAAIDDIQRDGFDVNEIADASIAENQAVIDKINNKLVKTRLDIINRKKAQDAIDYYTQLKARWAEVNQPEGEPSGTVANSEESINNEPQPSQSEGNVVPSQAQGETQTGKPSGTLTVEEQKQERIKALKAELREFFDDDFTKANDVYELVSMWVGRKRNLAWDDVNGKRGLQKELGWQRKIGGDTKFIETLLAKKGEGVGVDEFVHMVWESPENDVMGEKRFSTEEIKEALLELLTSARSKSDVVDHTLNSRERIARQLLEEQQQMEQEMHESGETVVDEEPGDVDWSDMPFPPTMTDEEVANDEFLKHFDENGTYTYTSNDTERELSESSRLVHESESGGIDRENSESGGVDRESQLPISSAVGGNLSEGGPGTSTEEKADSNTQPSNSVDVGQRQTTGASEVQTAMGAGSRTEQSQGSTQSAVEEYLQPRDAEEEKIIADVHAQLQQEIQGAINEQNKARSELQKAQARESERATDLFGNDNALNQPGQLFDNSDMPVDQSMEGVERRTAAERQRLQEATNKLNQLQSEQERNSRIRGALDNHRRQTTIDTDNPMEAIEQAAQQFREEQKQEPKGEPSDTNYGADNKLVSQERYAELRKRMIQKLTGQLNAGFDPEILAIGTEMAMFHIEAGARKFVDFAEKMITDLGDAIRPYLKAIYNGAREMPGMEELRKQMTSTEAVSLLDVQKIANTTDDSVNEHKQENNEQNNSVSLPQETEETVERKAEDADKYRAFSQAVANDMLAAMESGEKPYKSIKDIRAKAKEVGLDVDDEGRTDILLQELVEDGLVSAARQYVNTYVIQQMLSGRSAAEVRQSRDLFNDIVKLYNLQPSITQRSSNRIKMGQYSTPLPMSFVADVFAYRDGMTDVLEPTAGNGMMVFAIPEFTIYANELDETRLDNLRSQKFKQVTDQDATQPFEGDTEYDAIVANPPFGLAEAKEYDGKMIPGLAEQIAINALSKMKDDGKAAIIIGGNMEYADNGAIKSQKAFFTYLYDHYNVKGVIDMDGKLYQKQGTTYPTRLILIDGRRSEEERAQTKVYPPVKDNAPRKATTFDELFDIAEEIRNNNNKTNGNEVLRTSGPVVVSNTGNTQRQTDVQRRTEQSDADGTNGRPGSTGRRGSNAGTQTNESGTVQQPSGVVSGQNGTGGLSEVSEQQSTSNRGGTETSRGQRDNVGDTERVQPTGSGTNQTGGRRNERVEQPEEKRELSSDKLPYRPHNGAFSLESVAPAAMVEAMDNTLKSIEKEYGNIDDFVTTELGYDSVEEMHNALAAEQVDSVAMAIWNMKRGEGMIIGDQTGVGKGRQMAALIRWAVKQGKKPIFVTKDADLFSDIYRDLVDIGSGELRPFIFNSGVTITDANGVVVHKSLSDSTQKKVLAMNELPEGFDFAILSYPQMNTGDAISQEESGKAAKDRGERGIKKGKAVKAGRGTPKADFLRRIAKDNYLLMDESQNAAGSGNTGAYFQSILKDARAVTFASATFAKRPDTMPLYAIRTAISKAKVKTWELLQMIGKGGVTLQEIMSRAMTQAGQMVRRERDMSDVKTDWKTITDKATAEKARRNYDNVMRAFNAIIDFQENYIRPALAAKSMEFASMASTVSERRGTEKAGVDNPPFVNRLYNFSKQLLLSLKVDAVVDEVVSEIEAGRHPVIALENTLESALDEYAVGDVIEDPTLFGKLKKGLDATFRYTLKNEDGDEMGGELQPHELGPEGEQAYNDLVDLIQESTQGMFISPLDAITEKLEEKGYKVGEISGRKTRAVFVPDGKPSGTVAGVAGTVAGHYEVRKRDNTDRKKLARDFNSGAVDVLIINKTGSTGISLHASNRFSDQRQRTMIMAQPLSDINDYMQMIGRIDRTGQVHRGYYINLGLPVPAETRFMMMLANKLKSLNANTTTSQENKDNDVDAPDLLNKYGDQVMIEYLRDNPDIYRKLGEFLKDGKERGSEGVSAAQLDEYQPKEGDARQITGRVALLSVDEQDAFYDDVTRRYNELIKYLNDTGSNDLKISVLPLNARTIDREVSSEGTAPDSGNPFADNAYVEWVDMDVLKKPMKATEVGKLIEQLNPETTDGKPSVTVAGARTRAQEKVLEGKLTSRVWQIIATVEKETQEKLDKENERYEAAKKRAEEDIAAKAEAINKQQKRTPEQKKEAIDKYATERRQAVEESHQNMVNKIDANNDRLMKYLKMFGVGDSVLVPDDLTTDAFLGSSNGIFCGFKTKDEGVTPSTTLAVFATLDGRRKIEVKLSDWGALTRIDNMTQQNYDAAYEVTLSNWDEKIPSSSRKKGYIMTGNILQAISDTNFQGRLVTFTDDKGNVRDGVLMPDKWEPSQLKGSTVPISQRKERIMSMPTKDSVKSSDGRVTITRYWGFYILEVPKSKKQGGEFYLDKALLDLVDDNDFISVSGKMRARVDNSNIDAVLDRLGEMSVTLPSDRKVEFGNEEEEPPKRMITTSDPMKAISQASESWRRDNMPKEINNFINELADRFGLKGAVSTFVINSKEDLEAMRGKVSSRAFKDIEELYNEPDTGAGYIPRADIVVVFGEKIEDVKEAESIWWHEQAHGYWETLSKGQRESFGKACLDYLFRHHRADYNHIINDYPEEDHLNEACSFFIAQLISEHGTEKILGSRFEGIEEICNFADGLTNYIRNEREQGKGIQRNPLRYGGAYRSVNGAAQVDGRNSQEREGRGDSLRSEKESEITDPLEAIEQSAKRYRRDRAESEGMTPEAHSAKAVYDERLNRVETVFTEAYQDSMVALKTAQNAIAGDKDIPDSQNAYMAENLMHGKNKNEQDLYNKLFRDPLIDTINKIMNVTGMNWGDVDRYVYTKSGLERNREFYVRDWLEGQRSRTAPHSYEDLNDAEQSIFDVYAARIEEDFEDGTIATEEEKQKKLSQALQKAHEEYVNQIEQEYLSIKSERYLDLRDNVITFPEYLEAIDNFIRRTIDYGYEAEAHDYSGFRAMFGDEEGKYSEAEIIEELMETEAQMDEGPDGEPSGTVTELWEQIQDATRYGLERYREAGMRSDEQIDQIEQMFHWYVPMRGFTAETGEDMYQYFTGKGKAKSYVGGLLKHAKGRGSEASYPISTIFAMTYKAISDCNQNLVNQKLYRLCQAHPNDLVILSDSWARLNPMTGEWEEVGPDITEDMDEEEIREATLAWEEEMRQMASAGNAKKITGKARFDYKPMDKKNQSEHIVDVRINGQPRRMIVTGNPRMAQALNGQLKFEHGRNVFSKWNNYIKNKMATFFTSYSPTFSMRNLFRDWTHFRTMLGVREGHGYASQANKYCRQSLFKMVGLFKKYREGTLDESKEMERDFKDFMDNGGITGFVFMQKIDDIQKEMENIYKKQKAGKPIRLNNNLWEKILGAVEALNEGIENNTRFATYRASRHYAGRTKARSAYDAKEITVNFNRKGAGSKTAGFKSQSKRVEDAAKAFGVTSQILGEGRIFFNATVQAIATTFKNFQNPDGSINGHYVANWAMKYALPPFAFGLALPAINKALAAAFGGDDDDPYANLAEWTRRKNICIYIGNGYFITIPIGQELAAFLTLGDIAAGMTYAPDLKPVDRTFDQEMVEVMNTFSPVDISTKITKGGLMEDPISEVTGRTFSVLAPLVAVEQNLGWTGRPIYREDKFKNDQYSPEYQMVYSGTNPVLVNASKLLHEIGGGDDVTRGKLEVNPAIIQYLWEQYTGGPGKVFSNTISIGKDAKDILTGNESDFNVRKVEGLKAFVQQVDDRTQFYRANAKYRKYKADAEKLYDAVKGYESGAAENPEYLLKLEQISKGEDFVRMQIVREADKTLNQINKAANKAEGKERKVLRRLYNEQVKQVVDMLDSVNE